MLVDERCNALSPSLESNVPNADTDSLKSWIIAYFFAASFTTQWNILKYASHALLYRISSSVPPGTWDKKDPHELHFVEFTHNNNTIGLVIHWCKTEASLGISRKNVLRISIPNQNLQI